MYFLSSDQVLTPLYLELYIVMIQKDNINIRISMGVIDTKSKIISKFRNL